jgi:oxygen-dependent protoporphyrinogen oxidase
MISFADGMEYLIAKLAAGKQILYNSTVTALNPTDQGWSVTTPDSAFQARQVIMALPVNRALTVLDTLAKAPDRTITEAIVYNVVLGFDKSAAIPFGFGYLAPKTENRFALGTLFSIHMFPNRAPQGWGLIEILVGGVRNPDWLKLEDDELVRRAYQDVAQLIPLPKPVFSTVLRPSSGIPQLELGHQVLIDYRNRLQQIHPGLHICGFGWQGIGINDMIKDAKKTAADVMQGQISEQVPVQAKPIYF